MINETLTSTPITIIAAADILLLFIITIAMVICVKLSNISYKINSMIVREDDIKDLLTNMVQGSKRIERNVDAINQRTRAATAKKSKSKIDKRGTTYEGKTSTKSSHSKNNNNKRNNSSVRK